MSKIAKGGYAELLKAKDMLEVVRSDYYQKNFVQKYINDLPRMAFEVFNLKLSYQQIEVLEAFSFKGGRVVVPSGHGCHGINTPIMMSDGSIRKVQDIKVGDKLMGYDGKPTTVTGLCRGREDMYEVEFTNKETKIYNKSHILHLVSTQTHGKQKLHDKVDVTLREWLQWSDRKKRTHAVYKKGFKGKEAKLKIPPYFLGIWLSDGTSANLDITTPDEEVVEFLQDFCKKHNHILRGKSNKGLATTYSITYKENGKAPLKNIFREYNLIDNKHIPNDYLTSSIEQRRELLAGLLDGDGYLDKRQHSMFEIIQKREDLAKQIQYLARSLGHNATLKKVKKYCWYKGEKKENWYYRVNISQNLHKIPTKIKRKQAIKREGNYHNLRFGIKKVKRLKEDKYYGFSLDRTPLFLDGDFTVTHNTGKSTLGGFLSIATLLLFPKAIVSLTAPKQSQVTSQGFMKSAKANYNNLKSPRMDTKGNIKYSKWHFLTKFFKINQTKIYIKGYEEHWNIHPATAPKGSPENVAGLHNPYLLRLFDEASGIDDDIIDVALGAVSEPINSAILFSQHTRTSGRFHEFVTIQNIENGGIWRVVRQSSEQSPFVTKQEIAIWFQTYDENQYRVKVQGLPPLFEEGYLLNTNEVMEALKEPSWVNKLRFTSYTVSGDIAFTGLRDSSVVTGLQVAITKTKLGKIKLYIIVDEIKKFQGKNRIKPTQVAKEAEKLFVNRYNSDDYKGVTDWYICLDASSGGDEAYSVLEEDIAKSEYSGLVEAVGIRWGSGMLVGTDKKRFVNQRAKGYILLSEAIKEGRFWIKTQKERQRITKELTKLPFKLDAGFRYQMLSKKEMKQLGINSPDIADTFAQAFLIDYVEVVEQDPITGEHESEESEENVLGVRDESEEASDEAQEESLIEDSLEILVGKTL